MANHLLLFNKPGTINEDDPPALHFSGTFPGHQPGVAYAGSIDLEDSIGLALVKMTDGFLAPNGSLSFDQATKKAWIRWPGAVVDSTVIPNGDFASDQDWKKGTGWSITGGRAQYDGQGASELESTLAPSSPGTVVTASCDVEQGASSSGNVVATLGVAFYNSARERLVLRNGNTVSSGSGGAIHPSSVTTPPAPTGTAFASVVITGDRKHQNKPLYVDNVTWNNSVTTGSQAISYPVTLYGRDSAGQTALFSGNINVLTAITRPKWRVLCTRSNGSNYIGIGKLEFRESSGGDQTAIYIPIGNAANVGYGEADELDQGLYIWSSQVNTDNNYANPFDLPMNAGWLSLNATGPQWVGYNYNYGLLHVYPAGNWGDKAITEVMLEGSWNAPEEMVRDFQVQRAPIEGPWETVRIVTGAVGWSAYEQRVWDVSNDAFPTFKRWRIVVDAIDGGDVGSLNEIRWLINGVRQTPTLSGTDARLKVSSFYSGNPPWQAFDGDASNPSSAFAFDLVEILGWVEWDFGYETALRELQLYAQNDVSFLTRAPKDFRIQGTNGTEEGDLADWTTVNTVTNQTGWAVDTPRTFTW